jgi:hypothetical protein
MIQENVRPPTPKTQSPKSTYAARIAQLSARSVTKHFDAYADVDWDNPENRIELDDPRWQKGTDDPLGATEWYRSQPESVRAQIGLHHVATQMKIGLEFEAVLARGLLDFATSLPNGAPEFRYAYHEIIEEGQHSLMFQEFVNRTGLPVRGLSGLTAFGSRFVPRFGKSFPELFFLFVLGGEAPIDHVQRRALESEDLHPLLRRVMQIHVTEEARHLCFAKSYLAEHAPRLGAFRRFQLSVRAPIILGVMAQQMLRPPADLIAAYGIPRSVVREAYTDNPAHRAQTVESLDSVRTLCHRIGLITPVTARLWRAAGLDPQESEPGARGGSSGATRASSRPVPGIVRGAPGNCLRPMLRSA